VIYLEEADDLWLGNLGEKVSENILSAQVPKVWGMQDLRRCLMKVKYQETYSDILMILAVLHTEAMLFG
jgi:hypothetical protein